MSPTTSTQVQARKRRRGVSQSDCLNWSGQLKQLRLFSNDAFLLICQIIEKRRRDRINNSLSELRRLVPSAYEKQVSAPHTTPTKPITKKRQNNALNKTAIRCFLDLNNSGFFISLILKGSAKLEKAEILQMTVDHLKMLHAAGGKGKYTNTSVFIYLCIISLLQV